VITNLENIFLTVCLPSQFIKLQRKSMVIMFQQTILIIQQIFIKKKN